MRLGLALACTCLVAVAHAGELQIRRGPDSVAVSTGPYAWELSTHLFDVIHSGSVGGVRRLTPGLVTVEALGDPVTFGPPSEVSSGADFVELRGWADRDKHLWYIARYQFFADHPWVRVVLTLTDRHDSSPAEEPYDRYWSNRKLAHWRLQIGAPNGKDAFVTQHNSFSYSSPTGPWVEVVSRTGAPYQWNKNDPPADPARFQLVHMPKPDGANQVIWHPLFAGRAKLAALIAPFSGGAAYKSATAASYEVVDAAGQTHAVAGDQRGGTIELGTFDLGRYSVVRLKAVGPDEQLIIAGALRVTPVGGGKPFVIDVGERHDGVLHDGAYTIAVKDFWEHHPMSLARTATAVGWEAIERPEQYTGGMGLTIETMISMDGPAAPAVQALYAPPPRLGQLGLFAIDGSLARNAVATRYDGLLKRFADQLPSMLERMDNFGWRNWGDYQIGNSYDSKEGPVEDWANEQYDLPYGLLLAWQRTGDPRLWHFAQASVRHLMDLDLVKFMPFKEKLDGLVYRKGEMPRSRSHIGAEPITDQGFAWRSLLLYHRLTGEAWARDLARQNIDRLVYYAVTRPGFVLDGDRPAGWMLRAALAGAANFPGDPQHDYRKVADGLVASLVDYYRSHKHLPGMQPVWQGGMVEGLAEYHHLTGRADVAEAIVGHVRYFLSEETRKRPDGSYEFLYCKPTNSVYCPKEEWTQDDNYLFLWLGPITYAYSLTHDPFFARWADTLFAYGEAKTRSYESPRPWTSVLGFPHLYLELSPLK